MTDRSAENPANTAEIIRRFGFGLEQIGLWALSYPRFAGAVILLVTVAALSMLPSLKFDGNTANLLRSDRAGFTEFEDFQAAFPAAASSVTLHIQRQNGKLLSKTGLDELAELQLEISFLDGVDEVVSPFSLRHFDPVTKQFVTVLPEAFEDDADVSRQIQRGLDLLPELGAMVSIEGDAALMVIALTDGEALTDVELNAFFDELNAVVHASNFTILKAGLGAVRAELFTALVQDQIFVTLMGIFFAGVIAFVIFRNLRAVLLSNIPATLSVFWTLGFMAAMDQPLDPLTTILPIFASILTFADGLHLLSHWRRELAAGVDPQTAIRRVVHEVGPATSLTSVTTALALASLAVAGQPLYDLAFFGAMTVTIAFFSVIVVLPVLCRFMSGGVEDLGTGGLNFGKGIVPLAQQTAVRAPAFIVACTLLATALLLVVHANIPSSMDLADYLAKSSESHRAEEAIIEDFGGSDRIFLMMPLRKGVSYAEPETGQQVLKAHRALEEILGPAQVLSLAQIWRAIPEGEPIPDEIQSAIERSAGTVSVDGDHVLLVGIVEGLLPASEMQALVHRIGAHPAFEEAVITGSSVMIAFEASHVIDQLKLGLLLAAALAAGVVGAVCRSFRIGVGVLLANLFVVLLIEAGVAASGRAADFALFVALTIAIGIGVDDAVHIINLYLRKKDKLTPSKAILAAIDRSAPALMGSTFVLCTNMMVTQFSALPVVSFIGLTVSATLALALIANVIILPAVIVLVLRQGQGSAHPVKTPAG